MIRKVFFRPTRLGDSDARAVLAAAFRSQAAIEFGLDGTVLTAKENFLDAMGYALDEIVGQHHRIFVDPAEAAGEDYRRLWQRLAGGEFDSGEYRRLGKGGREVWIRASYNPVFDAAGRPVRVIKFATDVTVDKLRSADWAGQLAAISKSQAVIEFTPAGEVLTANDNFCAALGYRLSEIPGRHHRMFVDAAFAQSRNMQSSGGDWPAASSRRRSIAGWARAGARCGSRPPTIPSSIRAVAW